MSVTPTHTTRRGDKCTIIQTVNYLCTVLLFQHVHTSRRRIIGRGHWRDTRGIRSLRTRLCYIIGTDFVLCTIFSLYCVLNKKKKNK